ncbi:MAG: class I SAM-dependent methyltransferase [Thermoplasmata archaeon]|nr:class I SAM-dependent methyltransferase [Thermoplasmata archaeon]
MESRKFTPDRMARLDRPERLKEYDIPGIISGIGISEGMAVADIGAGTGFFSIPFSEAAGSKGRVLAVDLSVEMLEALGAKAKVLGLTNIKTVLSTEEAIPIPDGSVDIAFMSNVFHELEGDGTMREIARILKPGGRLAILDWKKVYEENGPPYRHRISAPDVISRCQEVGFVFVGEFKTGSNSHYGLLFRKM